MFDQLGQHTIVNLTNIKSNPKVSASLFKFKPPKGTDVVQQ
jgi:outer membrane lipoprotein carrier protein